MLTESIVIAASVTALAVFAAAQWLRAEANARDAAAWRRHRRRMSQAARYGAALRRNRLAETTEKLRRECGL